METSINPEPRKEQTIYDKPTIRFPEDTRMTQQERIDSITLSKYFVEVLTEADGIKWKPKPYEFHDPIPLGVFSLDDLKKKPKTPELPKKYEVEIIDKEKLLDSLKKQKEDPFTSIASNYLISILEANPDLSSLEIKRSACIYEKDYGIKFLGKKHPLTKLIEKHEGIPTIEMNDARGAVEYLEKGRKKK